MSRSQTLYQLQQYDSELDSAQKRIAEIHAVLNDDRQLRETQQRFQELKSAADEKKALLNQAESQVADQNKKIEGNQKKLYGGMVTNPKELEDLQLESTALANYLSVLEDRQLEAMLQYDHAKQEYDSIANQLDALKARLAQDHAALKEERGHLNDKLNTTNQQRERFLSRESVPDLKVYERIREASGGIAVSLMIASSCASCGSNIPSAIAQEARSPSKLVFCPTCKRILHPDRIT